MIIKREKEYHQLCEAYEAPENRLVILTGRRGIGKSTLVRQFIREKNAYIYEGVECSGERQKQLLKTSWQNLYHFGETQEKQSAISRIRQTVSENTYLGIFQQISHSKPDKTVIVIEDFMKITGTDPVFYDDITTLLKQEENIMVIMTSSTMNWREEEAGISQRNFVGQITDRIVLGEFELLEMMKYFLGLSMADVIQIYALLGGVPGYLKYWDIHESVQENILKLYIEKDGQLRGEAENYLRSELRELSLYNTVLEAMGKGVVRLNDIHEQTGFGRAKISVYMKNLKKLGVVAKCKTIDLKCKEKGTKGMYEITDSVVHFWSRFLYPAQTELALLPPEEFYKKRIEPYLEEYTSVYFERVCVRYMGLMKKYKNRSEFDGRTGAWYGEKGHIPFVMESRDDKYQIVYGRWTEEVFSRKDLERFVRYLISAGIGAEQYYIFTKTDFDEQLRQKAARVKNMHLINFSNIRSEKGRA